MRWPAMPCARTRLERINILQACASIRIKQKMTFPAGEAAFAAWQATRKSYKEFFILSN
jgi:hypothetical protein